MPTQASATRRQRTDVSDKRPSPIEPSETIEPSAPSWEPGQLYRDGDGSTGEPRDETLARLRALGIPAPLHKRFPCVLPGHDCTARVNFATAGYWQYRCDQLKRSIGLAEVRAFIAYRHERHLSGVEAARWRERLDFEAHLRYPIPLDVQIPEPCPEPARIVAGGMRKLVGLRDRRFPSTEPFIFASDFAQAYCDLSADQVRAGKDWLERAGVIYRTGTHGRAVCWKLAAQGASTTRDAEAGER